MIWRSSRKKPEALQSQSPAVSQSDDLLFKLYCYPDPGPHLLLLILLQLTFTLLQDYHPFIMFFSLKHIWFTMLCQSLLYSKVIQLYTYIHSFPLWFIPGDWISILHTPAKISSFANTAFHVLFLSSKHFINSIYRTKSKLLRSAFKTFHVMHPPYPITQPYPHLLPQMRLLSCQD